MGKRIVVFCDGTWKTPDDRNITNVVKLMRSVPASDSSGKVQVVFYDPGVGTESPVRRFLGGAFGVGLSTNVRDGYRFIANNYEDGDDIYMFGFSRGAFTARSIAGLIGKCGLLRNTEMDVLNRAYDLYRQENPAQADLDELRAHGYTDPKIHFVGVWDTVGSLGIPVSGLNVLFQSRHKFLDTSLGGHISNAYHAVAIDERRGPFQATLWDRANEDKADHVEQVWFSGVHSNVGGGYDEDGLANCALHWMAAKAMKHDLELDTGFLAAHAPDPAAKLYDSRTFKYKIVPPKVRDVDWAGYAGAAIHESVLQRLQQVPEYRPENLLAGLKEHPVVNTAGDTVRAPGAYSD